MNSTTGNIFLEDKIISLMCVSILFHVGLSAYVFVCTFLNIANLHIHPSISFPISESLSLQETLSQKTLVNPKLIHKWLCSVQLCVPEEIFISLEMVPLLAGLATRPRHNRRSNLELHSCLTFNQAVNSSIEEVSFKNMGQTSKEKWERSNSAKTVLASLEVL